MPLRSRVQKLSAKPHLCVWKRTSSPTTEKTIRKNILSYLSETTKKPDPNSRRSDIMRAGVDYLTKEPKGRLKAYGFLRDDIARMCGKPFLHLTNNERVEAAHTAWMMRLGKKKIMRTAHQYVLALDPELCKLAADVGISVDDMLTQGGRTVMRRYQEKHCPQEKIGYLMGIHHDREHIHAHIMLFPTTDSGRLLRVSDESAARGGRRPFTEMRETAVTAIDRMFDRTIRRPFMAVFSDPQAEQPKILAFVACDRAKVKFGLGRSPEKQSWITEEYERMRNLPDGELRAALSEGYELLSKRTDIYTDALRTRPEQAAKAEGQLRQLETQVSSEMTEVYRRMKELSSERKNIYNQLGELRHDLTTWRRNRCSNFGLLNGGYAPRDTEVRTWMLKQLSRSDEIGNAMRDWLQRRQDNETCKQLHQEMFIRQAAGEEMLQAERYTKRDPLTEKAIRELSPRIKDKSLSMLETYSKHLMRNAPEEDIIQQLLMARQRAASEAVKKLREEREQLQKKPDALRVERDAQRISRTIVRHAERGRRVEFLNQYHGWRNSGVELPVSRARPQGWKLHGEDQGMATPATDPVFLDGFHERVRASLRLLRRWQQEEKLPQVSFQLQRAAKTAGDGIPMDPEVVDETPGESGDVLQPGGSASQQTGGAGDIVEPTANTTPGNAPER